MNGDITINNKQTNEDIVNVQKEMAAMTKNEIMHTVLMKFAAKRFNGMSQLIRGLSK